MTVDVAATHQANKRHVWSFWQALQAGDAAAVAGQYLSAAHRWHGPVPLPDLQGPQAFVSGYWQALIDAVPDLQRRTHLFMGGPSNGRVDGNAALDGAMWVSGTGLFEGTFTRSYLGIPPTGRPVSIRWGECCRLEGGLIVETYLLLDLVDLMQQAGFAVLPPALGRDGLYPPPQAGDGILLDPQSAEVSAYSLAHIRRFIFDGLNRFDQSALKSMGMADHFRHDVHWYGPGGIGACLSFHEFESLHQQPWLVAYPDRKVQDLTALFAEGVYSGGPGWAGVKATHTGEYKGVPATGRAIAFNGMDWWKREGEQVVENWVFVDMVHLFQQFGVDLFERMRAQIAS